MRVLTTPSGVRYKFEPGAFSLELLLTGGPAPYDHYEVLHRPEDLVDWLADSMLADLAPLVDLRIRQPELARIKHLRDILWLVVPAMTRAQRLEPAQLAVINDSAAQVPRPAVNPVTGERRWVGPVTGAEILGAAARDAIDLLTTDRRERVRECAADDCTLLFLDTSRPGTRRWCSMQRCGNRHKVGNYRAGASIPG
ncbi:CGNR zinc finger domain-containing protein [Actinokineospora auranticolor]|uniref:Putative stress-induced transcription regulator n=1 Tax=Actinokineospora auranticolor TaxID=155976 RepID=A0A2S6GRM2_9PSEU|nr:CGNR zinc finger domain-containing protein [Actinokineospora auranticolor]PPK67823.1 putative stress-induced transcription regulator [Actinokineospora auranticolor]